MRFYLRKLNIRLMALVMAAALLLCGMPSVSAAETQGTCGPGLSWSFADGTLTITGSGDMTDYSKLENIPWYSFRDQILQLSLPEGLTSVGNMAFYDCYNLTSVTIPSTVTEIGELAFCQCSSVTILTLNTGLKIIGRSAFELCVSLQALRLPETLTTLGRHAFYRCDSIQYVTVPPSVTEMDSGVFAYCIGLVRAEVLAPLTTLPRWTFYGCASLASIALAPETTGVGTYCVYGCENLSVIYYGGEAGDAEKLREQISEDKADFGHFGQITDSASENTEMSFDVQTDTNGDTIVENTTVTQTEDVTVSVTTTTNASDNDAEVKPPEVNATVIGDDGWQDVLNAVEGAVNNGTGKVDVTVYTGENVEVPQSIVDALAGKNVSMKVQNSAGTSYVLDFTVVQGSDGGSAPILDLSYMLFRLDATDYPELADVQVFRLQFNSSSAVPAEVLIQLPVDISQKSATLFQIGEEDALQSLQSVVTDRGGVAHFYLGAVDSGTEYLIGINVPGVETTNSIIPDNMHNNYGVTDSLANVEYVVTGRTSSWDMSLGQVTGIMIGVMVACVAGIGIFMYTMNKKKLRRGYVPDLYDEEE